MATIFASYAGTDKLPIEIRVLPQGDARAVVDLAFNHDSGSDVEGDGICVQLTKPQLQHLYRKVGQAMARLSPRPPDLSEVGALNSPSVSRG